MRYFDVVAVCDLHGWPRIGVEDIVAVWRCVWHKVVSCGASVDDASGVGVYGIVSEIGFGGDYIRR